MNKAGAPESNSPFVTLARILRPRGRRGEVAAEILTDFPEHLTRLRSVLLWDGRVAPRAAEVRECWLHNGQAIFHFEGSDSIGDAEQFAGLEVQIPLNERLPLPAGSYYITDLIGCDLWERGGDFLGTVREVQQTGEAVRGTPLLAVATDAGELLVPLAEKICVRVDTAARRIEVVLPDGLRDVNKR